MFKSARWRSDKNKVKLVFKLQFHAAQLAQVGGEALMVSVVPADIGKPTVKSDKAVVREGSCIWENPIYETVKFNREPKSGKIHERIYYFVVGTSSSKSGVIGEASVDFANYAELAKVSLVSLPLKNAKTEAVLHVSIQRMQESVDQREVDESLENVKLNSKDHSLRSQLSNGDIDGTINGNSTEVVPLNKTVSNIAELNGIRRASSGSDVTISSSDTPREVYDGHHRSQWEWLGNSALEASTDDSSSTPGGASLRHNSSEASEIVIEKLKADLAALSRQVEISELELQTLRKQIVKESKKGQDLFKETVCLKEERDSLSEKLKSVQRRESFSKSSRFEPGDSLAIVEELRQELNHANELNANLRIQLQKTQESNNELLLAVRDLDEILEQKNKEIVNLSGVKDGKSREEARSDDDEEQKALEELVREHCDAKEAYLLEQQIMDLRSEIEIYKRDKDELEIQLEQIALDYEIMKQENHDMSYKLEQSQLQEQLKMQYECSSSFSTVRELESQIENLENELERRSKESSESLVKIENLKVDLERRAKESSDLLVKIRELESEIVKQENVLKSRSEESSVKIYELESEIEKGEKEIERRSRDYSEKISGLEAHVRSLEEELEKQAQEFEADLEALTVSKVEQEQRAIRAEETLRKTRWQNANTAERLQEEFRRLSVQMTSTFEANEKLAAKALTEANELRLQKVRLEGLLKKASEELESVKDHYEGRLTKMSEQIEKLRSEVKEREVQLENQKKHVDEISILRDEIESHIAKNKILSEEKRSKKVLMNELERMRLSIKEMELLVEQGNDEKAELEKRLLAVKNEAEESHKELRCLVEEKESLVGKLESELNVHLSRYEELKNSRIEDDVEKEKLRKQVLLLKSDLKKREDAINSMEKKMKDGNGRGASPNIVKATPKTNKTLPHGSKEVANLKERIKLLEGEIKLKEAALAKSTNTFLEKEKDLHNKIEELEGRLEVLNQNSAHYCKNEAEKAADSDENSSITASSVNSNGNHLSVALKDSRNNNGGINELVDEIALLKERNKSMEEELKEMQGRYSEISLKFAEVEGERQQLVMKLRNLKNSKMSP